MISRLTERKLVQEIQLPSRGVRYNGKIPDGRIKIAGVNSEVEEAMSGMSDAPEARFNTYIEMCSDLQAGDPTFNHFDLLLSDRHFMAFRIRALTYGPKYSFQHQCGSCRKPFPFEVNIDEIPVRALEPEDTEPFMCSLPLTGKQLGLRSLRGRDERDIINFVSQQVQRGAKFRGDPAFKYRLALCVVSVDGDINRSLRERMQLVGSWEGPDLLAVKDALDESDCGYEMTAQVVCQHCGAWDSDVSIPLSADFFRPRRAPRNVLPGHPEGAVRLDVRDGDSLGDAGADAHGGTEPVDRVPQRKKAGG